MAKGLKTPAFSGYFNGHAHDRDSLAKSVDFVRHSEAVCRPQHTAAVASGLKNTVPCSQSGTIATCTNSDRLDYTAGVWERPYGATGAVGRWRVLRLNQRMARQVYGGFAGDHVIWYG